VSRPPVSEKLSPPRSGVGAFFSQGRDQEFIVIYTESFKARMVQRLSPPNAVTAMSLSKEVGVSQSQLSRGLCFHTRATPRIGVSVWARRELRTSQSN